MAQPPHQTAGTAATTGKPARLALDFEKDRDLAFRRARIRTFFVRTLRVGLPVTAVALLASYGFFVRGGIKIGKLPPHINVKSIEVDLEGLTARDPTYEGFDKQGGHFKVHSKTAVQDFGQKGPLRLKTIDGRMIDAGKNTTDLTARSGTYDTKTGVLELFEDIKVVSQNGLTADLTRATVFNKESRITSDEPVVVTMPTGVVKGQTLLIEQKQKQITFDKGVQARLKQETKDKPGKPVAPTAGNGPSGAATGGAATGGKATAAGKPSEFGSFGASDAPVDITATKLFIDDASKVAVFSGNVVAVQGEATLRTATLEVVYEGQAAPAAAPVGSAAGAATPKVPEPAIAADTIAGIIAGTAAINGKPTPATPRAPADPAAASKIKRLVSKSDVVLTRGLEKATGNSAEFDVQADRAVLQGAVVITSGPDRKATSDRADLDNKTSMSVLTGNVVITSGADRQATADRADIDNKNDIQVLTGDVVVTQLKNVLKGRRLHVDRKAGTLALASPAEPGVAKGRISARMYQAAETEATAKKAAADAAKADQPKTAVSAFTMRSDPNQPIDIDSDTLDVSDKAKTATFKGAVHAVQGDYTIRTEELVVTYSGEAGMALGPEAKALDAKAQDPKAKAAAKQGGAQLQKVLATRPVTVTTKDGRTVNGNTAEFDTKANVITIIGDVLMSQTNGSVIKGPRAKMDLTSGTMQMVEEVVAGGASTAPPTTGHRMQAVLFKQDSEKAKDGKDAKDGAKDGKDKAKAAPAGKAEAGKAEAGKGAAIAKVLPVPVAAAPRPAPPAPQPRSEDTERAGWAGDSSPFERMGQ